VAEQAGKVLGTVMCVFAQQPNQPYRADVSKMLVHSSARRRGIGAALLAAVDEHALRCGKTLLVLDTEQGSDADRLYRRAGWIAVGTIPDYAYQPSGTPVGATFFYKMLAPTPAYQRPSPA
jgi:GNAT superfamily N-acetyltransferase